MTETIDGVRIGHAGDPVGLTGCTVVLLPPGSRGGVEVRGGAPGTRETDLLRPANLVEEVHAFLIAGGSAFGLAASLGVVRYLEERGIGYDTGVARVPIVPAGVLFDLGVGDAGARPDEEMGYRACLDACEDYGRQGNVGAGTGATVGKMLGYAHCTKSGLGAAFCEEGGVKILALAAVNALGEVVDERGEVMAGVRLPEGGFASSEALMRSALGAGGGGGFGGGASPLVNTTLAVVVTNAALSKTDVNWVAQRGHNGLARAIRPSHTRLDGDLVFAAATGEVPASPDLVGAVAAALLAEAVRNAVRYAEGVAGIPAYRDLLKGS
ncbi:MAG: P1 family peptidase [Actinobacteria bacterium]|nr:P1 family peptidase [Actinomycetota bacterium]